MTARLAWAGDPSQVEEIALRLLTRREHAAAELAGKLRQRGCPDEIISPLLKRFRELGYLDDRRFAALYVAERRGKGFGPLRIAMELQRKGLGADDYRDLLDGDDGWQPALRALAVKKFGEDTPADYAEKARRSRFFQQRGFTSEQIALLWTPDC
jgi:regulatory protein